MTRAPYDKPSEKLRTIYGGPQNSQGLKRGGGDIGDEREALSRYYLFDNLSAFFWIRVAAPNAQDIRFQ